LDERTDWPMVENILRTAVPPGGRCRLAVAGAAGLARVAKLAEVLAIEMIAPRGDVLLVPGASLFAVHPWWLHTGGARPAGRTPMPKWEADVDAVSGPG
jgi:hypothetical protein